MRADLLGGPYVRGCRELRATRHGNLSHGPLPLTRRARLPRGRRVFFSCRGCDHSLPIHGRGGERGRGWGGKGLLREAERRDFLQAAPDGTHFHGNAAGRHQGLSPCLRKLPCPTCTPQARKQVGSRRLSAFAGGHRRLGEGRWTKWLKRPASRLANILEEVWLSVCAGSARDPGEGPGRSGSKGLPAGWQKFLRGYGDLRLPEALTIREIGWDEVAEKANKIEGLH